MPFVHNRRGTPAWREVLCFSFLWWVDLDDGESGSVFKKEMTYKSALLQTGHHSSSAHPRSLSTKVFRILCVTYGMLWWLLMRWWWQSGGQRYVGVGHSWTGHRARRWTDGDLWAGVFFFSFFLFRNGINYERWWIGQLGMIDSGIRDGHRPNGRGTELQLRSYELQSICVRYKPSLGVVDLHCAC